MTKGSSSYRIVLRSVLMNVSTSPRSLVTVVRRPPNLVSSLVYSTNPATYLVNWLYLSINCEFKSLYFLSPSNLCAAMELALSILKLAYLIKLAKANLSESTVLRISSWSVVQLPSRLVNFLMTWSVYEVKRVCTSSLKLTFPWNSGKNNKLISSSKANLRLGFCPFNLLNSAINFSINKAWDSSTLRE